LRKKEKTENKKEQKEHEGEKLKVSRRINRERERCGDLDELKQGKKDE
jgi:hypothetical protein